MPVMLSIVPSARERRRRHRGGGRDLADHGEQLPRRARCGAPRRSSAPQRLARRLGKERVDVDAHRSRLDPVPREIAPSPSYTRSTPARPSTISPSITTPLVSPLSTRPSYDASASSSSGPSPHATVSPCRIRHEIVGWPWPGEGDVILIPRRAFACAATAFRNVRARFSEPGRPRRGRRESQCCSGRVSGGARRPPSRPAR